MKKNRYLYLIIAVILFINVFIFSYLLYQDWGKDWQMTVALAAAIVVGVVGFLADLKAILEPPPPAPVISIQTPPLPYKIPLRGTLLRNRKVGNPAADEGGIRTKARLFTSPKAGLFYDVDSRKFYRKIRS
jgi:hypothetical protein